jgi:hypothetical protein
MTTITIPDNVPLMDITSALRKIGLEPTRRFPPTYGWQPEPTLPACAHAGCTRRGTIMWDDSGRTWCADHAWPMERCA